MSAEIECPTSHEHDAAGCYDCDCDLGPLHGERYERHLIAAEPECDCGTGGLLIGDGHEHWCATYTTVEPRCTCAESNTVGATSPGYRCHACLVDRLQTPKSDERERGNSTNGSVA